MLKLMALWAGVLATVLLGIVIREERLAARGRIPVGRLRRFWLGSERRRAPRYRVNWSVRYERLEPPPMNGGGETRDISQTGAGLTLAEKLPVGSLIRLELSSPEEVSSLKMTAEVIWLKEITADENPPTKVRQFFIGIRFRDLDPKIEQQITRALSGHPSF